MTASTSIPKRTVAVGLAVLVVASLGVGPVASMTDQHALTVQDPENSSVRIAHMSADAPSVDVLVDNETVAQNLGFGDVTDYLDLQEGDHQVSIVTAADETPVLETQLSVPANERLTIAAVGSLAENATEEFRLVALRDARRAPNGTNSSVRVVHVSPDLGPVDVTINRTGAVLFDNVTFGNATDYATVPSGVYTLNVREATEDNDGPILSSHTESLLNRTAYSAFAAPEDEQPDEPVALFIAIDQTDNPEIPGVTTTETTVAENQTDGDGTDGNETTTEA